MSSDDQTKARQTVVLSKVREFLIALPAKVANGDGVAFVGSVGTGKDHLLSAMMFEAVRRGFTVEWHNGANLHTKFRSYVELPMSEYVLVESLTSADILCISDPIPPSGELSAYCRDKLLMVIDERYRNKKPIWWTLNTKSRQQAEERLSIQIVDRLNHGCLGLICDWPSFRIS